jgi:hypothetical protein
VPRLLLLQNFFLTEKTSQKPDEVIAVLPFCYSEAAIVYATFWNQSSVHLEFFEAPAKKPGAKRTVSPIELIVRVTCPVTISIPKRASASFPNHPLKALRFNSHLSTTYWSGAGI